MANNWITPFAYIDDAGALHLCCDRVLEEVGLPVTEENLRIAEGHLLELARQSQPQAQVYTRVERDVKKASVPG